MICKYAEIFCWKNVSSFCSATHIFSAKNIRILYIESAKTVNEMTLNELVKLTTLWTTGPRGVSSKHFSYFSMKTYCSYSLEAPHQGISNEYPQHMFLWRNLGPVVQSVVSLTSSLRVISLTVLTDSIYNILIFFAEKMWVAFALQKLLTFFQQKISAYLRITRCKF